MSKERSFTLEQGEYNTNVLLDGNVIAFVSKEPDTVFPYAVFITGNSHAKRVRNLEDAKDFILKNAPDK